MWSELHLISVRSQNLLAFATAVEALVVYDMAVFGALRSRDCTVTVLVSQIEIPLVKNRSGHMTLKNALETK